MDIKKPDIRRILFWVLIAVTALTLFFIFSNSLRGPEESMEQSNEVGSLVGVIFPPDTPLGGFIADNTRKIAHFVEYGILGVEIALLVIFYLQNKLKMAIISLPAAMCIAVIDETLQYFSGRGPAIVDVWIDLGGFAAFTLLSYAAAYLAAFIKNRIKRAKGENINNG